MNWDKKTLGEIYEIEGGSIQTGPFGSQLHESDYQESGIPVIMPKDIIDDKLDLSRIAFISEEDAKRLSQHIVQKDDIVCPRRGEIDKRVIIDKKNAGSFCGTGCIRLRGTGAVINPSFLFFFLKQPRVVKWIENQAIGATMMNLNTSIIKSIPIKYPKLSIQTQIATILSSYDELIENNKQRIKLLEEMAEEIYKEWFVRMRFPGYETAKFFNKQGVEVKRGVEGALPEGWEKVKLGDRFNIYLGGTPSREVDSYWNGNIPWINSGKVNDLRVIDASEYITELGLQKSATKLIPKRTTLLAITGATLGQVSYLEIDACVNQSVVGIKDPNSLIDEYVFITMKEQIKNLMNYAGGGAQQHINKNIVEEAQIIIANEDIMNKFTLIAKPQFELISNLLFKNQLLQQTRDLLLPRLISGKLSVEHLLSAEHEVLMATETKSEYQ